MVTKNVKYPGKRGFRYDPKSKTIDIFLDGERMGGFASFETLYADPTVAATATIGQQVQDPMGGIWRYCHAGAAITNPLDGAGCYAQPTDCTAGAAAIGSYTLAVSEITPDTSVAADQFANGTIVIGGSPAGYRRFYHIKGNTASATTTTTLTLYHPVTYTLAGTEWATIVPCPWYDVRNLSAAGGFMSVVCWPLRAVDSGYYFWGKTRGPVFGVPVETVPGAASGSRTTTFNGADGALYEGSDAYGGSSWQWAGYVISRTGGTYNAGDQTIMTQLE